MQCKSNISTTRVNDNIDMILLDGIYVFSGEIVKCLNILELMASVEKPELL